MKRTICVLLEHDDDTSSFLMYHKKSVAFPVRLVLVVELQIRVRPLRIGNCGEGEDVVGVHTLLGEVVQVCHELLVGEEEEKEEEQGRQEEEEVKGEGQSEETAHSNMDMEMGRMART